MGFFARLFRRKRLRPVAPPRRAPESPEPPSEWPPPLLTRAFGAETGPSGDPLSHLWLHSPTRARNGHVIVFANEKGGVGKSTTAFHTCIALCNAGESVAALDIDLRQLTLQGAIWARQESERAYSVSLPNPEQIMLAQQNENELVEKIRMACIRHAFVVIDVGGHDSPIARKAIALADTIVTPVNDSFIDLDMLGRIDPRSGEFRTLGNFARLVGHLREPVSGLRALPLDWVVMQNRSRSLNTKNEGKVRDALLRIAPAAGFRLIPGLRERVTYRELFPQGLTLLDLEQLPDLGRAQASAKAELWAMLRALNLPSEALGKVMA